jgi:hypothetical protein
LRFKNPENCFFKSQPIECFFWKRKNLKANLWFWQTLNCVFKNYFLKSHIFKSLFLNHTFWNLKPKTTLRKGFLINKLYLICVCAINDENQRLQSYLEWHLLVPKKKNNNKNLPAKRQRKNTYLKWLSIN